MRKLVMILLLLAGILFMTSCGGDKPSNKAAKADTDLAEDLQALDDNSDALAELGYDVDFTEDAINAMSTEGNSMSAYDAYREGFEPLPLEMFLFKENEYNKFSKYADNCYYCYGLVPEWAESEDGYEYLDFFSITDYDNNVTYLSVAIVGNDLQEGWRELKEEFDVIVYFKFIGYSYEIERPVGMYLFYEPVPEW